MIDLRTGNIAHGLRIESSLVTELYDVVVLNDVVRPMGNRSRTGVTDLALYAEFCDLGSYEQIARISAT